MTGNKTLNC